MEKFVLIKRGFLKKCPYCGRSPIFIKYIKTFKKCKSCGIALSAYKSDDGPAYVTIFIVGHILIPLILGLSFFAKLNIDCLFFPIFKIPFSFNR